MRGAGYHSGRMRAVIRSFSAAGAAGVVVAIAAEALLQALTSWIRVRGPMSAPWWAISIERSVWVAAALIGWAAAPILGEWLDDIAPGATVARRTAWAVTGVLMMAIPVAHLLGTWVILALQLSVSGTWGSEGWIFLSGAYYGTVLLDLTPWMAAGAILRAWARHMIDA